MKRVFSIILAAALVLTSFCVYSSAKTVYNAAYTLSAKADGKSFASGDTITVAPGSTVDVTLSFKNDFMIGTLTAQMFYNKNIFEGETAKFNTDGKFYEACGKSLSNFTAWNKLSTANRDKWWPDYSAEKLKDFKSKHNFCYVSMATNSGNVDKPVRNLDEKIVTVSFKVKEDAKDGTTGQIIIPLESVRRKDYLNGYTMCSVYPKDDILSTPNPYAEGLTYNLTKAVLNFKVAKKSTVSLGDVNKDGSINSTDALMILQHAVGQKTLTGDAKTAADVNRDGSINSSDALRVLQFSVGNIKSL